MSRQLLMAASACLVMAGFGCGTTTREPTVFIQPSYSYQDNQNVARIDVQATRVATDLRNP